MTIVPFAPDHLLRLDPQPEQTWVRDMLAAHPGYATWAADGQAWTCLDGDTPLVCAGIVPDGGAWRVWAVLAGNARRALLPVVRFMKTVAATSGRLETYVRDGFAPGERLALMLGFHPDVDASAATGPDGRAYRTWVRHG